jgi:neutral ceramidase
MHGTREGEGIHGFLPWLVKTLGAKIRNQVPHYDAIHGPKAPVTNNSDRFVFGFPAHRIGVPAFLGPEVAVLKRWGKAGAFQGATQPLTPTILPVQLFIIGSLAIAALPTEPTTQVARRCSQALLPLLQARGVARVLLAGYCNAYSGYTTTQEEYCVQAYEGGSTHFGQWTCAAYQTVLYEMAQELLKPPAERRTDTGLRPHTFTPQQLAAMAWQEVK